MSSTPRNDSSGSLRLSEGDPFSTPPRGSKRAAPVSAPHHENAPRLVESPGTTPKPEGWTRFVCFSDTHGLHDQIAKEHCPEGDVLLHAGDFTNTGELDQVESFVNWLGAYPAKAKVVIAGNHDVTMQPEYYERMWGRYHPEPYDCEAVRKVIVDNGDVCTYLEDEVVEVMGYTIYGSPWQPEFCDWAFNLPLGEPLKKTWERIPAVVDVLLTHGPPGGKGDLCSHGAGVGCPDLLTAIQQRRVPVSLAGHIHEAYGTSREGATLFINASTCTLKYRPWNPPIVFDLPPVAELRAACAEMVGATAA